MISIARPCATDRTGWLADAIRHMEATPLDKFSLGGLPEAVRTVLGFDDGRPNDDTMTFVATLLGVYLARGEAATVEERDAAFLGRALAVEWAELHITENGGRVFNPTPRPGAAGPVGYFLMTIREVAW